MCVTYFNFFKLKKAIVWINQDQSFSNSISMKNLFQNSFRFFSITCKAFAWSMSHITNYEFFFSRITTKEIVIKWFAMSSNYVKQCRGQKTRFWFVMIYLNRRLTKKQQKVLLHCEHVSFNIRWKELHHTLSKKTSHTICNSTSLNSLYKIDSRNSYHESNTQDSTFTKIVTLNFIEKHFYQFRSTQVEDMKCRFQFIKIISHIFTINVHIMDDNISLNAINSCFDNTKRIFSKRQEHIRDEIMKKIMKKTIKNHISNIKIKWFSLNVFSVKRRCEILFFIKLISRHGPCK